MKNNLETTSSGPVSSRIINVKDAFDLIKNFKGTCSYSRANLLVERIAFSKVVKSEDVFGFENCNWVDLVVFSGGKIPIQELYEDAQRINEQHPEYSPLTEINGWKIIYSYKPRTLDSILLQDI